MIEHGLCGRGLWGAWLTIRHGSCGRGLQKGCGLGLGVIYVGVDYGEAMDCDWAWIMWAWLVVGVVYDVARLVEGGGLWSGVVYDWAWVTKGAWLLIGHS